LKFIHFAGIGAAKAATLGLKILRTGAFSSKRASMKCARASARWRIYKITANLDLTAIALAHNCFLAALLI